MDAPAERKPLFAAPTETISVGGEELTVRGLTLPDIITLVSTHARAAATVFARLRPGAEGQTLNPTEAEELAQALLVDAPDLAIHVIAMGLGDREYAQDVAHLGFPKQLELLEAVGRVTFYDTTPKKAFETIARISQGVMSLVDPTT